MKNTGFNCNVLCKMQANLFYSYSDYANCSPLFFIRRFMNSNLAKRFDDYTILLDSSSNETLVDELNEQYGETSFGKPIPELKEALYWVGYLYRYWCYTFGVSSKNLVAKVHPKMLVDRYYLYHSMDLDYVIERISEEENISFPPKKTIHEILEELMSAK